MNKHTDSKFLEVYTPGFILKRGFIDTAIDIPMSQRVVLSHASNESGYHVHTEAEDLRWDGQCIVHIIKTERLNDRLIRMLWINLTSNVWDVELQSVIHLQKRAKRSDFSAKEQVFYTDLSKGNVSIKEFLISTIRMVKDKNGWMYSPYEARFSQYVLFHDGRIYRFAISYKFDISVDSKWHRMVFCRNRGSHTFFPITVMVDHTAADKELAEQ